MEDKGKEVGISKFGEDAKPRKRLAEYCRLAGHNRVLALEMLEKGADLLMKQSRTSSASTASGLRMWGHFAQDFLLYAKGRTLPPHNDLDLIRFTRLFHNPGTCANYVGHVPWACVKERVSLHWDTPSLRHAITGVKITHVDYYGGVA